MSDSSWGNQGVISGFISMYLLSWYRYVQEFKALESKFPQIVWFAPQYFLTFGFNQFFESFSGLIHLNQFHRLSVALKYCVSDKKSSSQRS